MTSSSRAIDIDELSPGLAAVPRSTAAAIDLDGRLVVAGRPSNRAVADDEAAAIDQDSRGVRSCLGSHSLKNHRAAVGDDGRRVASDDRSVGERDGTAIDDKVPRGGSPLDDDIASIDGPVDRRDAGRDDHRPTGNRRITHGGVAAGRGEVDLHAAGSGDRWPGVVLVPPRSSVTVSGVLGVGLVMLVMAWTAVVIELFDVV